MKKQQEKKVVRILLRVSSDQQLEADGDLGIQREIVIEDIRQHSDWILDSKEYFEGSNSGYKNSITDRDVLQEALRDAENGEYDILAAYKDDRLGRRMFEVPVYIMSLKNFGVDVYTVKDKMITPQNPNDVTELMMLTMRYGMAQKSSSDTGLRVRDTAQKLVQQGRFLGGKAPYGYRFELSDIITKRQRMINQLVIVPEQAEVVKYIYNLSFHKEFGSGKIASTLNEDDRYRAMAPNDVWKSGTITSILTNPIYAGYPTYNRRQSLNGKHRSLNREDWTYSEIQIEEYIIIEQELWEKVQIKRTERAKKYVKNPKNEGATVISRNDGMLALIDVAYCGYCGRKMTNGTKYDYWTIKATGERRTSKKAIYKCQNVWQGVPHEPWKQIRADKVEPIVFGALAEYIGKLQENENVFEQIMDNQNKEKKQQERKLLQEKQKLDTIKKNIDIMEDKIPEAMTGTYILSLEDLVHNIEKQKQNEQKQAEIVEQIETELQNTTVSIDDWETLRSKIPTWQEIFLSADTPTKRVLVNKLIERIDMTEDEVVIRFKINLDNFLTQSRMTDNESVQEQRIRFYNYILYCIRPQMDTGKKRI
ncbi:recombinase family protein [Faecalicatena orotica]|uniref:Recombinase-like zinc beta ribbon protein n=1 Tax=Faecalicatena orotica TaxID=1544 RepID=A0A2Y9BFA3_9FIRM|nr:recombinase family protein [Faecalicatena orotica]PWJ29088.1 recombinase-like zinc beta ribbon protein [Faecalicatena orotica]SSA56258.1 Recombinase zinc beta ribbon domain-containing protein [Faecalicatena orotica]